jgi:type IV secretory pathway VirB10-like protein
MSFNTLLAELLADCLAIRPNQLRSVWYWHLVCIAHCRKRSRSSKQMCSSIHSILSSKKPQRHRLKRQKRPSWPMLNEASGTVIHKQLQAKLCAQASASTFLQPPPPPPQHPQKVAAPRNEPLISVLSNQKQSVPRLQLLVMRLQIGRAQQPRMYINMTCINETQPGVGNQDC